MTALCAELKTREPFESVASPLESVASPHFQNKLVLSQLYANITKAKNTALEF
jgi:hypothetical protein